MDNKEEIYKNEIEPVLATLRAICERERIPMITSFQVAGDGEMSRVAVQQYFTPEMSQVFDIAGKILRGELEFMDGGALINAMGSGGELGNVMNRIKSGIVESLEEHAKNCPECAAQMDRLAAAGEDTSDITILRHFENIHDEPLSDASLVQDDLDEGILKFLQSRKTGIIH